MKKYSANLIILAIAFSLQTGCSLDPERKFTDAIDRYLEKKPGSLIDLQHEFIDYIAIQTIESRGLKSNGNVLYTIVENDAEIAYPEKIKLSMADGEGIKHIYLSEKYCAITDGQQFSIFDPDGSYKNDETIGDKKKQVKAILISDDNIIYYKDLKLFNYNIIINTSEPLLKETFPPPFQQYFNVYLSKIDSMLGVQAGIAGSYNYSLINLSDNSVLVKNLGMASSKFHMDKHAIYYIAGNAGNWELMNYDMAQKKKKSIARLSDIEDIELVSAGYILEAKNKIFGARYGKEKFIIPFPYILSGKYRGRVVLRYKDSYYIIDINKLFSGIDMLRSRIPDMFAGTAGAVRISEAQQKQVKK